MRGRASMAEGATKPPVDEASVRISDARVWDIAFRIRQLVGYDRIKSDDATTLARILTHGIETKSELSERFIFDELIAAGRSRRKAEDLSRILFK